MFPVLSKKYLFVFMYPSCFNLSNVFSLKKFCIICGLFKRSDFIISRDFMQYLKGSLYFLGFDMCYLDLFIKLRCIYLFYLYNGQLYICDITCLYIILTFVVYLNTSSISFLNIFYVLHCCVGASDKSIFRVIM